MKILNMLQGSKEWVQARIGVVTASCMDKIITAKKREPSASQPKYMAKLLTEWFLGESLDEEVSQFMQRGKSLEETAAKAYEFDTDWDTQRVGFVLRDDGKVGASPDRLVGDDGLLEIKVPGAVTHVEYLMDPHALRDAYWVQAQGQLWVCEREWTDLISFHPTLPTAKARIVKDAEFCTKLAALITPFLAKLDEEKARLAPFRPEPKMPRMVERDSDPFSQMGPEVTLEELRDRLATKGNP